MARVKGTRKPDNRGADFARSAGNRAVEPMVRKGPPLPAFRFANLYPRQMGKTELIRRHVSDMADAMLYSMVNPPLVVPRWNTVSGEEYGISPAKLHFAVNPTKHQMKKRTRRARGRHQWLRERNIDGAFVVLRIDDYATTPTDRGQFYPVAPREPYIRMRNGNALWPSRASAEGAAKWATEKFGHQYGIFEMTAVVEHAVSPVKITAVKK